MKKRNKRNRRKKAYLLIGMLCIATLGMAQANYLVRIQGNGIETRNANCAFYRIDAILANGQRVTVSEQAFTENVLFSMNDETLIPAQIPIVQFDFYAERRFRGGTTGSRCGSGRRRGGLQMNVPPPYNCFRSTSREHGEFIFGDGLSNAEFDIELIPQIEIAPPPRVIDNFLPLDHSITLRATQGFDQIPSNYTWVYTINGEPARLLPNRFQGLHTISGNARDFFGSRAESVLGREVEFRIRSCNGRTVTAPTTRYQIIPSAPEIVGHTPILPDCYDGNGGVRFTFSRPLFPGEQLSILPSVGFNSFASELNITQLQPNASGVRNTYTIMNIPPGTNYQATVNGFYRGTPTFSDARRHNRPFSIGRPSPVTFSVAKLNDDYCNDGDGDTSTNNDGRVRITAAGGNPGTYEYLWRNTATGAGSWLPFSGTTTHTLTGLGAGRYDVQVRKRVRSSYCVARTQVNTPSGISLGGPIVTPIAIETPDAPLAVNYTLLNAPTAFGFADARLQAVVTGGTPLGDGSYNFEWRDQSGALRTTTNTTVLPGDQGYRILLHSIEDGVYTLTVRDANFSTAFNTNGCAVINSDYSIQEPPRLEIRLAITNEISCSNQNEYSDQIDTNFDTIPDQFQDGEITAIVTGGVPFDVTNPGAVGTFPVDRSGTPLPYRYEWKIRDSNNNWIPIDEPTNRIRTLSTATYALNVIDSNGITVGTYESFLETDGSQSYRLVTPTDATQFLPQPERLEVTFSSTMPSCAGGDDATAMALVTGGTPPYQYRWSTGDTVAAIRNLIGGKYVVFVTDGRGCQVEGTLTIDQPGGIAITPMVERNPTCIGYSDGAITLQVSGGTPPYAYQWVVGSTSNSLSIDRLPQGTYRLRVTDANDCTAFYEHTLEDPAPIVIDLGPDRALCLDQQLTLDGSISTPGATYLWTGSNGFSSTEAIVTLAETGTYTVTATTPEGCMGSDTIAVTVSDIPIDAEYLLSSQAYPNTEVVLVNISWPLGERTEWVLPEGVTILEEAPEYLHVSFAEAGDYTIGIRSYQGECIAEFEDKIIVLPDPGLIEVTTPGPFIEKFTMAPNPSTGNFSTSVVLAQEANITLQCINLQSATVVDLQEGKGQDNYTISHRLTVTPGVYLMILETPGGSQVKKLVIE